MGLSKEMKQAMDRWLETAKAEFAAKLDSMCCDLEQKLLQKVGELETKVQRLEGRSGVLESEVQRLEGENGELRQRLNMMERYNRGDSLEIHNVPVSSNENVEDIVMSIANAMDVDMSLSDISTVYRMPVRRDKQGKVTPRLYVKFTRRCMKKLLYASRTKKKVTHDHLGLGSSGKIYIHEHLTKSQSDLYFKTKDKVKELGYKFVWTQDMNIYVRYNERAKRILIASEDDLDNLPETPAPESNQSAPTLRPRKHQSTSG